MSFCEYHGETGCTCNEVARQTLIAMTAERDAGARLLAKATDRINDLEAGIKTIKHDLTLTQDAHIWALGESDRWRTLALKAKEALEEISKDTIRIEYRGEDMARYEQSEVAKIAKAALALFEVKP